MTDDLGSYGGPSERDVDVVDVTPQPLDAPGSDLPHGAAEMVGWPTWLPPGALALAAAGLALVSLLGNGISTSFGYVLRFTLSDNTNDAAHAVRTGIVIQLVLALVALVTAGGALRGLGRVEDVPRWTRDLAIAAVLVAAVAVFVHWALLLTFNGQPVPAPASVSSG
jgi:hypothetical protein